MSGVISVASSTKDIRATTWIALFTGGHIDVFDGTQPTTPEDAITTQNKLVSFTLPNPSGTVANGAFTGDTIGVAFVEISGTATWARAYTSAENVICDMEVGTTGTAVTMNNTIVTQGAIVSVTGWGITEQ